jgi:RNA polymerase sigma-70 factor, ECF subfamily
MPSSNSQDSSLAKLVERAQGGDREAESALLGSLEPVLRGFFIRRVGHHRELDDLVQNTLLRVFRGLNQIKDKERVRGFALKAALFELQDLYRGRYGSREATIADDLAEPAVAPESSGVRIDIERALASLTPRARRIIELKSLGYRYGEIAGMVESTEAAVKMQVKRALQAMRSILMVLLMLALPNHAVVLLFEGLARLIS